MEKLVSIENGKVDGMFCRYEECCTTEDICPNLQLDNCECLKEALKKLAEYQNAEEQGLLLHLKAGVGSEIYDLDGNKYIVKHFTYYSYFQPHFEYEARNEEGNILRFKDIHIDKTIFLTKEKMEQKVAELNQ